MGMGGQLFALAALLRGGDSPLAYVGGLVGPRAGLDSLQKRYISRLCREANHDWPIETLECGHAVFCTGLVVTVLKEC